MQAGGLAPAEIAGWVVRALREELAVYPKPGLVSFVDNGSHPDMDAGCFLESITCLEPFFQAMAASGAAGEELGELQRIGLAAEGAMLEATGGRNTHRGAIFCLGLLAAAAGVRSGGASGTLGEIVAGRWGGELPMPGEVTGASDGLLMCRRHGVTGARGEAKGGYPSIYGVGLPALRRAVGAGMSMERAGVQVFFDLLACCGDTTLLKRGGSEGLRFAREEAGRFLVAGGIYGAGWEERAEGIHRAFVARGLTAGGVADLLAATLFVHYLEGAA